MVRSLITRDPLDSLQRAETATTEVSRISRYRVNDQPISRKASADAKPSSISLVQTQALVRPLGFEPRTCGLRVRFHESHAIAQVSDVRFCLTVCRSSRSG